MTILEATNMMTNIQSWLLADLLLDWEKFQILSNPGKGKVILLVQNISTSHTTPWFVCTNVLTCNECPGDLARYTVSVSFTFPVKWAAEVKGFASVWNWQYGKAWVCGSADCWWKFVSLGLSCKLLTTSSVELHYMRRLR